MTTIQRFEDLQSWQKARQLANTLAELKTAYDLATEAKRLINGMIAYLRKQSSSRAAERSQKRAK